MVTLVIEVTIAALFKTATESSRSLGRSWLNASLRRRACSRYVPCLAERLATCNQEAAADGRLDSHSIIHVITWFPSCWNGYYWTFLVPVLPV